MSITLKKISGKSKRSGKDFQAFELKCGLYSTLIFPSPLESQYLDKYLTDQAHEDFKDDETDPLFD